MDIDRFLHQYVRSFNSPFCFHIPSFISSINLFFLRFSSWISHTFHSHLFSFYHLHQLRQHPFYLPALHLIVVEVHVIQEFITQLLIHVTTIACGYEGDGGKFSGGSCDFQFVPSLRVRDYRVRWSPFRQRGLGISKKSYLPPLGTFPAASAPFR